MWPGLASLTVLPILKVVDPNSVIDAVLMATANRAEQEPRSSTRPYQAPDMAAVSLHTAPPKPLFQDQ